ncbi:MAG TPA: hypothetical protein VII59_12550, partial [Streptosporangiaceae bacterium]
MLQPTVRRVALGAMQAALVAVGIFVIMLLFSRPAHAATAALPPLTSTRTTAGPTAASTATGLAAITSTANPVVTTVG